MSLSLDRADLIRSGNYISGEWLSATGPLLDVTDPATGNLITRVPDSGADEALCAAVEPIAAGRLGDIAGRGTGNSQATRDGHRYSVFKCSFEGSDGTRVDVARGDAAVFRLLDPRHADADEAMPVKRREACWFSHGFSTSSDGT